MSLQNSWQSRAYCFKDKYPEYWCSYDIKHIEYAKNGCSKCQVKKECMLNAIRNNVFVGVVAGMSEFDFLIKSWHPIMEEDESNWE